MPDTTSGFRAYNREAALQILIVSHFTYTLESIIQSGKQLVALDHVPVATNPVTRKSRLFTSTSSYVRRNAVSIFRIYAQYEPLRVFLTAAAILLLGAFAVWVRFVVAYAQGHGSGHVQSLILGAVLFNAGVVVAALGVIGDLLSAQRSMIQRTHERVRRIELQLGDTAVALRVAGGRPGAPAAAAPSLRRRPRAGPSRRPRADPNRRPSRPPPCRRRPPGSRSPPARRSPRRSPTRRTRDSGHALRRRRRHRQHLRQVQRAQPGRAPAAARLRAQPR